MNLHNDLPFIAVPFMERIEQPDMGFSQNIFFRTLVGWSRATAEEVKQKRAICKQMAL